MLFQNKIGTRGRKCLTTALDEFQISIYYGSPYSNLSNTGAPPFLNRFSIFATHSNRLGELYKIASYSESEFGFLLGENREFVFGTSEQGGGLTYVTNFDEFHIYGAEFDALSE